MQTNIFQKDHKKYIDVVRENVSLYGKENASIQELLAMVIGNSANDMVCNQLSLLSVRDLFAMTATDFLTLDGVSKSVAERLEAAIILAKKLSERNLPKMDKITSPDDAYQVFRYLQHEEQEKFVVAFLNTKNEVIGREEIFKGTLNASIVHPRDVYRRAVQKSAASIIVAHSHPSGDPSPSAEDYAVTERLVKSGKIIGIELLDHIVVGDGRYVSLKEEGRL